jgi:hypothetical protein
MSEIFADLKKNMEVLGKIFNKIPDIKFHINTFCGIAADTRVRRNGRQAGGQVGGRAGGQAGRQAGRQAGITKQRDTSRLCEHA